MAYYSPVRCYIIARNHVEPIHARCCLHYLQVVSCCALVQCCVIQARRRKSEACVEGCNFVHRDRFIVLFFLLMLYAIDCTSKLEQVDESKLFEKELLS